MHDTELYHHLLGLQAPWSVADLKLEVEKQRVDVWVDHPEGTRFSCPECNVELAVYDHTPERVWRHLDSCQFLTYLHARLPRVCCPEHGVKQVAVAWAEPRSQFTLLFERLAIGILLATDVQGASRILRISWDEAWGLMERAVARGQRVKQTKVVARLGVDEKAAAKGHAYITIVSNLDEGTVEYIGDDRKKESLDGYFAGLTPEQRVSIEAVAMDMWEPFIRSTRAHVPLADDKIVFDRYHIMGIVGKAVDDVRKGEHRALTAEGGSPLAKSKYLWLYAEENLPAKHQERFALLKALHLKTGRAWALKECLRGLWSFTRMGWARRHWQHWYRWATHSRLRPMIKAAQTIRRHLVNVMTYFQHRITNAVSEGLNSKIQTIKKMAYGFRNREHFKTAIYFHCGGLQLYPVTHTKPG
jgi:transposase